MSGWTEELHPRDKQGEFTHGQGWVGKLSDRIGGDNDESLEAGIASGIEGNPTILASGTQGSVFLVRFKNGMKGVKKVFGDDSARSKEEQIDAEELSSIFARGMGLDAPEAKGHGKDLFMGFKGGKTLAELGSRLYGSGKKEFTANAMNSRDGVLIGIFDQATGNVDRNSANILSTDGKKLSPIDHGWAFDSKGRDTLKQFGGNPYVSGISGAKGAAKYSKADIKHIKEVLEGLREEFQQRGRGDWYDSTIAALDQMAKTAKGKGSLF